MSVSLINRLISPYQQVKIHLKFQKKFVSGAKAPGDSFNLNKLTPEPDSDKLQRGAIFH